MKAFQESILKNEMPSGLSIQLQALWLDGSGDWQGAHDLIDRLTDKASAHVHAYLHRKEGDVWNADYWYRQAGKTRPNISLEEEWHQLVKIYFD